MRDKDIFNPEYKEDKPFWTRKRVKGLIIISVLAIIVTYGASEFVYSNTLKIEIRTIKYARVGLLNWNIEPDEELFLNYIVINKSPYDIMLKISTLNIRDMFYETSYNDEILIPDRDFYVWFKVINHGIKVVNCGIRIRGERA